MRPLTPGLLLQRYRLERRLGVGASGDVWLARESGGEAIALKARRRRGGEDERDFRQEFERLRTLRIPSVVQVLDIGADQGYVFFTMDVAHGLPFDRYVQDGSSLSEQVRRASLAGSMVANALVGIHNMRLAHRDVKPANIMVDDQDHAVLLDFGTLRFGATSDEDGNLLGTPAFMAPEQRVGLPHDHRVDIYALGATLHQAISGAPSSSWLPGKPRTSLTLLGREVPLRLGWIVDQMLLLDPAERPSAERVASELSAIAMREDRGPCPWPSSTTYVGDIGGLLESSAVIHGPPGSGRRRMIKEARWAWYQQGYRSVAGQCDPTRPFGALRQVLEALFMERDPEIRRQLTGSQGAALLTICPSLPIPPSSQSCDFTDFEALAAGLAHVLEHASPIAVVLWDLDRADIGTHEVLQALLPRLGDEVRIWAHAPAPVSDLPEAQPPPWSEEAERAALGPLLPEPDLLDSDAGTTPLESCIRAWRALATWRGETGPPCACPEGLSVLSILGEVFPFSLAHELSNQVNDLLEAQHLRMVSSAVETARDRPLAIVETTMELETTEHTVNIGLEDGERTEPMRTLHLCFTDDATRCLAESALGPTAQAHLAAARAWERSPRDPDHWIRAAEHALESGSLRPDVVDRVIKVQLERGAPAPLDRWLQIRRLHYGESDDFQFRYAQLYVDLELRPSEVTDEDLDALAELAQSGPQSGMVRYLQIIHQGRQGSKAATEQGRVWAQSLHEKMPAIAAIMLREVAQARLIDGDYDGAVDDCQAALDLAIDAARRVPAHRRPTLTHAESHVSITLSGALVESGRLTRAITLCEDIARRAREAGMNRSEGSILANLAVAQYSTGDRQQAGESLARCRRIQAHHRDPIVHAVIGLMMARLTVEKGDIAAGEHLLDDAITTAQGLQFQLALAEAWSLALEVAIHKADQRGAQLALASYGVDGVVSPADIWPAVLARWFWLTGDLERALQATEARRDGHSGLCVRGERARILLLLGRYDQAHACAQQVVEDADRMGAAEISLFASLVRGVACSEPDVLFVPRLEATRESRWVHLYLGALHLDAIRRQRRGEDVQGRLRKLRARSRDLGHRLYSALARGDAW